MRKIAVVCSDLHFCHLPPAARSAEPDWYLAMKRPIDEIRDVMDEFQIPLIIAGDFFDKWNPNPELVNFLLDWFPTCYSIVGQHDIAYHRRDSMHKTAYGTMVRAGKIKDLIPNEPNLIGDQLAVWAFPWGCDLYPLVNPIPERINLLVAHRYVWMNERTCYPGAPKEQHLAVLKKQLEGYDAAVFGDNHKGFLTQSGNCSVLNCGGFMPRKSDERSYKPRVGLLMSDGEIDQVFLDTSKDRWIDLEDEAELIDRQFDLSGLVGEFESLGADALDFEDALIRMMEKNGTDESVRQKVVAALQKGREDEAK